MEKRFILAILTFIFVIGCTPKQEEKDPETLKKGICQVLDQYLKAWNIKDIKTLDALTSDNGIYFGSDPDEIMDKKALMAMYREFFADSTNNYRYDVNLQEIIPAENGESIMAVEYITFKNWSPKIPFRQSFRFVKQGKNWIIDFITWGIIVKNKDIERLNKILE